MIAPPKVGRQKLKLGQKVEFCRLTNELLWFYFLPTTDRLKFFQKWTKQNNEFNAPAPGCLALELSGTHQKLGKKSVDFKYLRLKKMLNLKIAKKM